MPRYVELPPNTAGRDFIAGDIHGCYEELKKLLQKSNFHSEVDRLFLVGDVIDRGPDSEKCLQLLLEDYVYAVQGNHEQMYYEAATNSSTWMTLQDYWDESTGGGWTRQWFESKSPELTFWANKIAKLPHVIHVHEGKAPPFWVVHAELWSPHCDLNGENIARILKTNDAQQVRILQWSRKLIKEGYLGRRVDLPGPVYCGHTPVSAPGTENMGHINLDAGAGVGKWREHRGITHPSVYLMCHTTGQSWSEQVASSI